MKELTEPLPLFCERMGGHLNEYGDCEYMDKKSCDELGGELMNVIGVGQTRKHPKIPERYGGKHSFKITSTVCSVKKGIEETYVYRIRHEDHSETVKVHPLVGVRHAPHGIANNFSMHRLKKSFEKMPRIIWQSNVHWFGSYNDWNTDRADTGASYTDIQEMDDGSLWVCMVNRVSSSVAFGPHISLNFRYHVKGETAKKIKEKIKAKKEVSDFIEKLFIEHRRGNEDVLDLSEYNHPVDFSVEKFFSEAIHENEKEIPSSVIVSGSTIFENKDFEGKNISEFTDYITKKANKVH